MPYDPDMPANVVTFKYNGAVRVVQDVQRNGNIMIGHEVTRDGSPTHAVKSYRLDRVEGAIQEVTWDGKEHELQWHIAA